MSDAPRLFVDAPPLLHAAVFTTHLPAPLADVPTPPWLEALLRDDAAGTPFDDEEEATREAVRRDVRDLLRHGGYKPTGRGKPASEYLTRAAASGRLGPINALVDACNAVSLHSRLPISVVDLDRATGPFRIAVVEDDAYVFNPSGQEMRLDGLVCLHDAEGPCANAVKDSQRTKTHDGTRRTLSVLWGLADAPARTDRAVAWYRDLLHRLGATTEPVQASRPG